MVVKKYLLLAGAVIAAAGCSSSPAAPQTLTAQHLAQKITQCTSVTTATPSSIETAEVSCTLLDGAPVTIGTFATPAAEQQWIAAGGSPATPDPAYAGCCIQGDDWAATLGWNTALTPMEPDYQTVIAALGGRQVTG